MEAREAISSGVTVIGAEAPSAYHVVPRSEAPSQVPGPDAAANSALVVLPVTVGMDGATVKKKRGRPRKYGPDGSVNMALSPLPLSSSAPASNKFSSLHSSGKRGKSRGMEYKQSKKFGGGDILGDSMGTSFMPHIITVNAGEDITMKVISFSQQGPRAICILSATGVISNVTLRQPDSSGGTLTYEGRFEILSLTGSFMPTDSEGTRSRSGGMSVTLSSPDGRVLGGGVAGLLVAASPVQVVVGSFLPSNPQDPKPKKQKHDYAPPAAANPAIAVSSAPPPPSTNGDKEDVMGGHVMQHNPGAFNSSLTSPSAFRRDSWVNMHSMPESIKSTTDINISLPDN